MLLQRCNIVMKIVKHISSSEVTFEYQSTMWTHLAFEKLEIVGFTTHVHFDSSIGVSKK